MLAGPNGSGKSTLFEDLRKLLPIGHWLNPDKVERELARDGGVDFSKWGVVVEEADLHNFFRGHGLCGKLPASQQITLPPVIANRLVLPLPFERTYLSSILCDYLRTRWLTARVSFTFETVMSHPGKFDFFSKARTAGYRTYLYFICTDSPLINQDRVTNRAASGGHDVAADKIVERYQRSLALMPIVVRTAWRAYLFDNSSSDGHRLVAEFHEGRLIFLSAEPPPVWAVQSSVLA
jgi:predicted ABC-type ATPase